MLTIEKEKKRRKIEIEIESSFSSSSSSSPRSITPLSMKSRNYLQYNTILQYYNTTTTPLYSTLYSNTPLPYSTVIVNSVKSNQVGQFNQDKINEIETCLGESQGCFGISEREKGRKSQKPQTTTI